MRTSMVLMAAGFGTRFGAGVKQIQPVGPNGEVLMDYAIHDALKAGFDRVVFTIRKDIEDEFRAGVGRRTEAKCDVSYAFQRVDNLPFGLVSPAERKKPWGTAHAVMALKSVVNEPFMVLNADDYYGAQAFGKVRGFLEAHAGGGNGLSCCMGGYVLGNTLYDNGSVTRGICAQDENGYLTAIQETGGIVRTPQGAAAPDASGEMQPLPPDALVSMNLWGFPPEMIDYLEQGFLPFYKSLSPGDIKSEYLLPGAVEQMIAEGAGSVKVLPTSDAWFGMTYAADTETTRNSIRSLINQGVYPEKL